MSQILPDVREKLFSSWKNNNITVAVAESCTGGLLSAALNELPGSSAHFLCGVVAYGLAEKQRILQVDPRIIEEDGAVSAACAQAMVQGLVALCPEASLYISVTGLAGPEGDPDRDIPVGTVHFAVGHDDGILLDQQYFGGNRAQIREQSVARACELLLSLS